MDHAIGRHLRNLVVSADVAVMDMTSIYQRTAVAASPPVEGSIGRVQRDRLGVQLGGFCILLSLEPSIALILEI